MANKRIRKKIANRVADILLGDPRVVSARIRQTVREKYRQPGMPPMLTHPDRPWPSEAEDLAIIASSFQVEPFSDLQEVGFATIRRNARLRRRTETRLREVFRAAGDRLAPAEVLGLLATPQPAFGPAGRGAAGEPTAWRSGFDALRDGDTERVVALVRALVQPLDDGAPDAVTH